MRLRDIAADTILVAVTTLLLVLQAIAVTLSWGPRYWPLSGTTAALVCAATVIARRASRIAPLSTAAAMLLSGTAIVVAHLSHLPTEPAPATVVGLAVLVAVALRHRPPVTAAAVATGGLAIVAASRLLALPVSSHVIPGVAAAGWLAAVVAGLALRWRDSRRRHVTETVRREERLELARELHDVVAHHITGIVLQAQAAQLLAARDPTDATGSAASRNPPPASPSGPPEWSAGSVDGERERLVGALVGIEAAGSEALAAMRRVVGVLRDRGPVPAGPAVPGAGEFGELVRRFEGQGFPVRVRWPEDGIGVGWPPEVTSTVYRIVREALTNVSRHATRAGSVSVAVERAPGGVRVEVSDDAPAGSARFGHRGGYGLVGMRERVETLGGTLTAGPGPGAGWTVRATLPVPATAEAGR